MGPARLSVHYDQQLRVQRQDAFNWAIKHNNRVLVPSNILIAGPNVIAGITIAGPTSGGSLISYFAAPPQVFSLGGLPAAPFADFPLTVIP